MTSLPSSAAVDQVAREFADSGRNSAHRGRAQHAQIADKLVSKPTMDQAGHIAT